MLKRFARSNSASSLRMAPLIDVIFLLLIFFFVTSQFRPIENYLPIDMPKTQSQGGGANIVEPLLIYVFDAARGCEVQFSGDSAVKMDSAEIDTGIEEFVRSLRQVLLDQKRTRSDPVELIFDDNVEWDYVAKIYNLLFGCGVKDITFRLNE